MPGKLPVKYISKENFIIYNKVKMLLDLKLNTIPNAD